MNIANLVEIIKRDKECEARPTNSLVGSPNNVPQDLMLFFQLTDGLTLFVNEPYGIEIVGRNSFIPTNKYFYPEDWAEIEAEVSSQWYLIGKVEELSQYISIDLSKERNGQCYDSFYETHSLIGDTSIIARNFTELLLNLYKGRGKYWYWLENDFKKLGDAYDAPIN